MNRTKRKIFNTAVKLFAEKGYDNASTEEITAAAGVAKGSLYYHFSKKEDIFDMLLEEGIGLLKNSVEIKTKKCNTSLEKIKAVILIEIKVIVKYEDFLNTYKLAKEIGFKNINVDLMIGLPEQTLQDVEDSLIDIISLNPKHISVYSLILEENTKLEVLVNLGKLDLPTDEVEREMYWKVKDVLEANGYEHYEISNFAKKGYKSKHNYNCWKQHSYLGFGVAAHSYYNNIRYSNTNSLEEYLQNPDNKKIEETQTIEDAKKEYMMLGLRTLEGVSISEFKQKYVDNPLYLFKDELNKLTEEGLVEIDLDNIKLTNKGLDLANIVWEEFV